MSNWQPIETAPKDKTIRTKIWHGNRQFIVKAIWMPFYRAWMDVDPNSSVGWVEGTTKREAFWDAA